RPWRVLNPALMTSSEGATLTRLADGSILAGGKHPDSDTYTIVAPTNLKGITGLRLEVLPDSSLPLKGPGRHSGGNFHLSELTVTAASTSDPKQVAKVPLRNAFADFEQGNMPVSNAIDGNEVTAWGIVPRVGEKHWAVFEMENQVGHTGGTTLTVQLRFADRV